MTLDVDEVVAQLKPLLEQHLSHVHIGIDGDKGFISGKKAVFLSIDIRFTCRVSAPTTRVTFDLHCSPAAKVGIDSLSTTLRHGRPFIEVLDSTKCVINLEKIPVGDKKLTDFIILKSAHVPGPNGLFAAMDVTFKTL